MKTKKFNPIVSLAIIFLAYCALTTAYNAGKKLAIRDKAGTMQLKK